jgi:hypothetical protein
MTDFEGSELNEALLDVPVFLRRGRPERRPVEPCRCGERPGRRSWASDLARGLGDDLRAEGFRCTEATVWRLREGYLERYYLHEPQVASVEVRLRLSVGVEFPELELPGRRWDPFHVWPWIRPASRLMPGIPTRWECDVREEDRLRAELAAVVRGMSEELAGSVDEIRLQYLERFPR